MQGAAVAVSYLHVHLCKATNYNSTRAPVDIHTRHAQEYKAQE